MFFLFLFDKIDKIVDKIVDSTISYSIFILPDIITQIKRICKGYACYEQSQVYAIAQKTFCALCADIILFICYMWDTVSPPIGHCVPPYLSRSNCSELSDSCVSACCGYVEICGLYAER